MIPVTTKKELFNICLVSSNYNHEIATIASDAISAIDSISGISGNLEIEESKTGKNELILTKGLFIRRGYVSEEFTRTQFANSIMKEVTLDYPLILVLNDTFNNNEDIINVLEIAQKQKRPLLIFSMEMKAGPLSVMLYNAK